MVTAHGLICIRIKFLLGFIGILYIAYTLLNRQRMGVKDLIGKFAGSRGSEAQQRLPPPIPHHTRPSAPSSSSSSSPTASASIPAANSQGRPYAVVRDGSLELSDGTPFRFASLNAPELLDSDEFEVEDTFRTLQGFGRRVTRCYTLKVQGTSPHLGDAGHIRGWDASRGDWIYHEAEFVKVCRESLANCLRLTVMLCLDGQDASTRSQV